MSEKIVVVARIRPFVKKELEGGDENVTKVREDRHLTLSSNSSTTATKHFTFDRVLHWNATQADTFQQVRHLLEYALLGYNTSIFTYGQTGTGKTHTMLGLDLWNLAKESGVNTSANHIATDDIHIGIIPRSVRFLFDSIAGLQQQQPQLQIAIRMKVAYMELYNEKLLDLLSFNNESQTRIPLEIRENTKGQILIPNLTQIEVVSLEEVLEVLWIGAKTRSVAATDMNDYSSRSHTIFQVNLEIEKVNNQTNTIEIQKSKICLIDLAGSEKWKSHQLSTFSQERISELTSINKSLSALGNCISSLMKSSNNNSNNSSAKAHIPYRDSKLTRLLQDSLGGNTKTAFIVTISPSIRNFEETASTLQFADRAMRVQVFTSINKQVMQDDNAVAKYQLEINRLTNIVKVLLKKCLDLGVDVRSIAQQASSLESDTTGNELALPSMLQFDLIELKKERDGLVKQLAHTQDVLIQCQSEKRKILEVIFEGETAAMDSTEGLLAFASDDDNIGNLQSRPRRRQLQRHRQGGAGEGEEEDEDEYNAHDHDDPNSCEFDELIDFEVDSDVNADADALVDSLEALYPLNRSFDAGSSRATGKTTSAISGSQRDVLGGKPSPKATRIAIQFRVLQALREEIDRRREALAATDIAQEDRWCWLQQYHGWLQAQAQLRMQRVNSSLSLGEGGKDRAAGAEDGDEESETIYDRVCLMETSVLLQSEELERAKIVFLKTNSDLMSQLESVNKQRDDHLDTIRTQHKKIASMEYEIAELRQQLQQQRDSAGTTTNPQQHLLMRPQQQPMQQQLVSNNASSKSVVSNGASSSSSNANKSRKPPTPAGPPPPLPAGPPPPPLPLAGAAAIPPSRSPVPLPPTSQPPPLPVALTNNNKQTVIGTGAGERPAAAAVAKSGTAAPLAEQQTIRSSTQQSTPASVAGASRQQSGRVTSNGNSVSKQPAPTSSSSNSSQTSAKVAPDTGSRRSSPATSNISNSNASGSKIPTLIKFTNSTGKAASTPPLSGSKPKSVKIISDEDVHLLQLVDTVTRNMPTSLEDDKTPTSASDGDGHFSDYEGSEDENYKSSQDMNSSGGSLDRIRAIDDSGDGMDGDYVGRLGSIEHPVTGDQDGIYHGNVVDEEDYDQSMSMQDHHANNHQRKIRVSAALSQVQDLGRTMRIRDDHQSEDTFDEYEASSYDALQWEAADGTNYDGHVQHEALHLESNSNNDVDEAYIGDEDQDEGKAAHTVSIDSIIPHDPFMHQQVEAVSPDDTRRRLPSVEVDDELGQRAFQPLSSYMDKAESDREADSKKDHPAAIAQNVFAKLNYNKIVRNITVIAPEAPVGTGAAQTAQSSTIPIPRRSSLPTFKFRPSVASQPIELSDQQPEHEDQSQSQLDPIVVASISNDPQVTTSSFRGVDDAAFEQRQQPRQLQEQQPQETDQKVPNVSKRRNTIATTSSASATSGTKDAKGISTPTAGSGNGGLKKAPTDKSEAVSSKSLSKPSAKPTISTKSFDSASDSIERGTNEKSPTSNSATSTASSDQLQQTPSNTFKAKTRNTAKRSSQADLLAMAEEILNRHKSKLASNSPKKEEASAAQEIPIEPEQVKGSTPPVVAFEVEATQNVPTDEKSRRKSKKAKPLWRELLDSASGDNYYHNRLTGQTVWERPSDEEMALLVIDGVIVANE